jgi:hypothetical protein
MNHERRIDPKTGRAYLAVKNRGRELLLDPMTNKGTGFPREERDELGLAVADVATSFHRLMRSRFPVTWDPLTLLAAMIARDMGLGYTQFIGRIIDEARSRLHL